MTAVLALASIGTYCVYGLFFMQNKMLVPTTYLPTYFFSDPLQW